MDGIKTSISDYSYTPLQGVITQPCPNFNGGLAKPSLNFGLGRVIISYRNLFDVIISRYHKYTENEAQGR